MERETGQMAASLVSKDRVTRIREEAIASITQEKASMAEGLQKATVEIVEVKKVLLEAKSEVEAFEDHYVELAREATLKACIVMMKEYQVGGAYAWDLDATITENEGLLGPLRMMD